MLSSPMKTRLTPALTHLSMKRGMRWHCTSTWIVILISMPSRSRSSIDPVEDLLPVLVAGEVVVRNEEAADSPGPVVADDPLHVVRATEAGLAPVHVDDGAKAANEGTAAARVEAGDLAECLVDPVNGHEGRWLSVHVGEVVQVVVDGLELAPGAVPGQAVKRRQRVGGDS